MNTVSLNTVGLGNTVRFRGTEYVVVKHNAKNTVLRNEAGQQFNLNGIAPVEVVKTVSFEEAMAVRFPTPTVHVGDMVRINDGGKFAGLVGIVSKLTADKMHIVTPGDRRILATSLTTKVQALTVAEFAAAIA